MGSELPGYPEESPVRPVSVEGFWMDAYPVTVAEFREFVLDTGYSTVASRLAGWQAKLVYYDPLRLAPELEQVLHVEYLALDQLLRVADAVTIHVPLNARTRQLIDAESLSLMKPTAVLVNTARGGIVDEEALATALRDGRLHGAGLDVFDHEPLLAESPLLELNNVMLTPHSAGPTWQSFPRRFANCFANIERVQRGEKPLWVVEELADIV